MFSRVNFHKIDKIQPFLVLSIKGEMGPQIKFAHFVKKEIIFGIAC